MKMTDADERALAAVQEAMNYAPRDLRDKAWLGYGHIADRLAADQQKGGGEAAAGLVSGYLPASRCVEIKLDGPIPDWVKELPKRAYLTSTAELEAVGRSGEGRNADWCAGWNAHNLIMSAPQPSIPAPAQQVDDEAVAADNYRWLRCGGWEVLQDPKYWRPEYGFDGAIAAARADVATNAALANQPRAD